MYKQRVFSNPSHHIFCVNFENGQYFLIMGHVNSDYIRKDTKYGRQHAKIKMEFNEFVIIPSGR